MGGTGRQLPIAPVNAVNADGLEKVLSGLLTVLNRQAASIETLEVANTERQREMGELSAAVKQAVGGFNSLQTAAMEAAATATAAAESVKNMQDRLKQVAERVEEVSAMGPQEGQLAAMSSQISTTCSQVEDLRRVDEGMNDRLLELETLPAQLCTLEAAVQNQARKQAEDAGAVASLKAVSRAMAGFAIGMSRSTSKFPRKQAKKGDGEHLDKGSDEDSTESDDINAVVDGLQRRLNAAMAGFDATCTKLTGATNDIAALKDMHHKPLLERVREIRAQVFNELSGFCSYHGDWRQGEEALLRSAANKLQQQQESLETLFEIEGDKRDLNLREDLAACEQELADMKREADKYLQLPQVQSSPALSSGISLFRDTITERAGRQEMERIAAVVRMSMRRLKRLQAGEVGATAASDIAEDLDVRLHKVQGVQGVPRQQQLEGMRVQGRPGDRSREDYRMVNEAASDARRRAEATARGTPRRPPSGPSRSSSPSYTLRMSRPSSAAQNISTYTPPKFEEAQESYSTMARRPQSAAT